MKYSKPNKILLTLAQELKLLKKPFSCYVLLLKAHGYFTAAESNFIPIVTVTFVRGPLLSCASCVRDTHAEEKLALFLKRQTIEFGHRPCLLF